MADLQSAALDHLATAPVSLSRSWLACYADRKTPIDRAGCPTRPFSARSRVTFDSTSVPTRSERKSSPIRNARNVPSLLQARPKSVAAPTAVRWIFDITTDSIARFPPRWSGPFDRSTGDQMQALGGDGLQAGTEPLDDVRGRRGRGAGDAPFFEFCTGRRHALRHRNPFPGAFCGTADPRSRRHPWWPRPRPFRPRTP